MRKGSEMEINFLGLGSDLKKILYNEFNKNEEILYVFENPATYYEIKREYLKGDERIFNNFKLMKKEEFYEKLLETDKIIIREEKQVVLFYNSLTDSIRKNLKIENYYDVIDLAYNFYNLFSELQEYKVDIDKIKIEEWQKDVFENLLEINRCIEEQVKLRGLTLPYMLRKKENISEFFLKGTKKICFINKVKFTPFEKEVIQVFEERGTIVRNVIQIDRKDFDEEKLMIKGTFGLPDKKNFEEKRINIEIHQFDNKFTQLMGIVKKLDTESRKTDSWNQESQYRIYDVQEINGSTRKDYQLLNQNKITYNLEETMENSSIYKILSLLCNILGSIKIENKSGEGKILLFKLKEIHSSFKNDGFLKVFNLRKSYDFLQELTSEGYKYISLKMPEISDEEKNISGKENLLKFLEELEKIYSIDNLQDYGKFLEEIFEKVEEKEEKIRSKYFEALSEMVVLEEFSFDNLWHGFFKGSISASLLKMFLKYLDKKAISLDLEEIDGQEAEKKYKINSFSAISETRKENIIFLNLQDSFPKVKVNNYLFSKNQRISMGLPVNEDIRQMEFFKFFNNIFGGRNIYLSYVKNLDENIDCAGVIEEMKLKYGIQTESVFAGGEISEGEEISFIKKYFTSKGKKWEKKFIGEFIPSRMEKDRKKIMEEKLSLGYYGFEKLRDFEYGYYLEKMIGKTEKEEIDEKIDPLLFGNIIHAVYERIVKENKEQIESKKYNAEINDIKKVLSNVLAVFEYKIPAEFIKFYREVSFDEIARSIKKFFDALKNGEMEEIEKITRFEIYSEEKVRQKMERGIENKKYPNVFINGVIDLYITAGLHEILIDYKSGNLNGEKLVKAQEQLDFYSILLGNEKVNDRKKYVVDTWKGEIIKDTRGNGKNKSEPLIKENIDEVIRKYFENDFYGLGERNRTFNHRIYKDIARREDEDDENRK